MTMGVFQSHTFSPQRLVHDLDEFGKLLNSKPELAEQEDILPFFQGAPDLAVYMAGVLGVGAYDLFAAEVSLAGSFRVDLALGSSSSGRFMLIEFEDARAQSIFRPCGRSTPEWAPRFLGGLAQLSDWFWKIEDLQGSDTLLQTFGHRRIDIQPVLVIGRESSLGPAERARLDCLRQKMLRGAMSIYTFDELLAELRRSQMVHYPA